MQALNTLASDKIKLYFPYHRICLVKTLLVLVNCMLQANSCNLNKAKKKGSIVLGKTVNPASLYKRFIRFFKMKCKEGFVLGLLQLVLTIVIPHIGDCSHYCLAIDRTNWKLGKHNINILFIGFLLGNGRFIPIYFSLLPKKGNSSQAERKVLLERIDWFLKLFKDKSIVVVGDREFIGLKWFAYLIGEKFGFVMRLKKKDYVALICEELGCTKADLEKRIAKSIHKKGYFVVPIQIDKQIYYYHVRNKSNADKGLGDKDKYVRFLSTSHDHEWVVTQYRLRWNIEVFFEDCKSKGFDLEAINFTDIAKIRLMVAICALCYAICLVEGIIEFKRRPSPKKLDKQSGKTYNRVSVFTKGYEIVESKLTNVLKLTRLINRKLKPKPIVNHQLIREHLYDF